LTIWQLFYHVGYRGRNKNNLKGRLKINRFFCNFMALLATVQNFGSTMALLIKKAEQPSYTVGATNTRVPGVVGSLVTAAGGAPIKPSAKQWAWLFASDALSSTPYAAEILFIWLWDSRV
jgi:hypothetical protein